MFDEQFEKIKKIFHDMINSSKKMEIKKTINNKKTRAVICGVFLLWILWGFFFNEKILDAFMHPINRVVFVVILVVFLWGLRLFRKGKNSTVFPSLLTTIGVFGTFFGIFIGLLDFDVNNIKDSVPELLEGLKIAFLSSVEGMSAALLFRGILLSKQEKNPADVFESLARANSDSITGAMETFIKDFNQGLTEQIGENFKQLNEAVERMVQWLDIHKEFMEKTTPMIENARDALQSSADSLQKVEEATAPLAGNIGNLGHVIGTVDEQMQTLKATLEGVSDLGEQAKAVFPALQSGVNQMTENMDTALRQATQNIEQSITTTLGSMDTNINSLATQLTQTTQDVVEAARQTQDKIENNFKVFDQNTTEAMGRALRELGNQLTSISGKLASDYEVLATEIKKINALAVKLEGSKR